MKRMRTRVVLLMFINDVLAVLHRSHSFIDFHGQMTYLMTNDIDLLQITKDW